MDSTHGLIACAGDDCRVRVWSLDRADPCVSTTEPAVPPHQSQKLEEVVFPEQIHALCWASPPPMASSSDTAGVFPALLVGCAQKVYQYDLTPPPLALVPDDDAQTTL